VEAPLKTPVWLGLLFLTLPALSCGVTEIERPPVPVVTDPAGTGGSGGTTPATSSGGTPAMPSPAGTGGLPGTMPPGGDAAAPATGGSSGSADAAASPPTSGPPPSGITVSIGGMTVPKEKAIVILHIGHSNMAGRALDPATEKGYFYDVNPRLWKYGKGGVWTGAKEPLCPDMGTPGHPQGAGPGMALLHAALNVAPDAYVISIGRGRSLDFNTSCWSFRKGGLDHDLVMGPALELKGKVTFGGLFTMLGYDGRNDARAKAPGYLECLKGLAQDFRDELGEPNLPFIVGNYEAGAVGVWSPTCCGAPEVRDQLSMVPAAIPHSFLIPSTDLPMQDDHHYNMIGHHQWADRAFAGMAAGNMLPWATLKK
jgi:hypothetical protein